MKNNELLKKYAGISTRIRRIFAYHYDQINPTGSTNRDFNTYPRITGTIHGLNH